MKFGVMFDFRNPAQWRRPDPALYRSHLDEMVRLEEAVAKRRNVAEKGH
jgi:hypothetical protein